MGNIFLTGATGLLGRCLLRDLLDASYQVTVLVRDSGGRTSLDRVRALMNFGSASLGRDLPQPTVLNGDLAQVSLRFEASALRLVEKAGADSGSYRRVRLPPGDGRR
jgi:thioester reductase-like protein